MKVLQCSHWRQRNRTNHVIDNQGDYKKKNNASKGLKRDACKCCIGFC